MKAALAMLPASILTLLLPLLAAAAPSNRQPPIATHPPATGPISQALYDDFEELARVVDIAYCVGSLNTGVEKPFECLSFCKNFPSFELKQTWNTGLTLSDSCGYIALSHAPSPPRIIVAFRGTYSLANALADLSFTKQEYIPYPSSGHTSRPSSKCNNCFVHSGFLESWSQTNTLISGVVEALRDEYPSYQLTLVGHSLGGAVAALAGLDYHGRGWEPVVTTFGEPKIGNAELAAYLDARFTALTYRRVTHRDDPVPLVPLAKWGYVPHGYEYFIDAVALPYTRCDIRLCVGDEDATCSAGGGGGGGMGAVQRWWAHRDYFHRMGLCVPEDSVLRRIRIAGEETVCEKGVKEEEL